MIRVVVYENDANILKVAVLGHARYADFGKDIVCASVSTCVITTVNGILEIYPDSLEVEEASGKLIITFLEKKEIIQKLTCNMIELLTQLSEYYPKNIKIIRKEGIL